MKMMVDGVRWGGPKQDWYWFYWWNRLPRRARYLGFSRDWYDGPIASFGFWFFNWTWSTRWTLHPKEYRSKP